MMRYNTKQVTGVITKQLRPRQRDNATSIPSPDSEERRQLEPCNWPSGANLPAHMHMQLKCILYVPL